MTKRRFPELSNNSYFLLLQYNSVVESHLKIVPLSKYHAFLLSRVALLLYISPRNKATSSTAIMIMMGRSSTRVGILSVVALAAVLLSTLTPSRAALAIPGAFKAVKHQAELATTKAQDTMENIGVSSSIDYIFPIPTHSHVPVLKLAGSQDTDLPPLHRFQIVSL